ARGAARRKPSSEPRRPPSRPCRRASWSTARPRPARRTRRTERRRRPRAGRGRPRPVPTPPSARRSARALNPRPPRPAGGRRTAQPRRGPWTRCSTLPELPEVEVVRRGLEQGVVGRTIETVTVSHDRAVRRHVGGAADFVALLAGRTVLSAGRRGKYLWFPM